MRSVGHTRTGRSAGAQPELYNMHTDPGENDDVAPVHPEMVTNMRAGVQNKIPTFPAGVLDVWNTTTKSRCSTRK